MALVPHGFARRRGRVTFMSSAGTWALGLTPPRKRALAAVWERMFKFRGQDVQILKSKPNKTRHDDIETLPWNLQRQKQQWAAERPEIYQGFRQHWWNMVAVTTGSPHDIGVLIIERKGGRRASVEEKFKASVAKALPWLPNHTALKRVDLAAFSVEDQVRLASRAHVIIGSHGAGLSNMIFARSGTLILEMGERAFSILCYRNLALRMGHTYVNVLDPAQAHVALKEYALPHLRGETPLLCKNTTPGRRDDCK
eukprot:CAMPEP_0171073436 /NCGR_PEP_ID=MMETSP0766_2-20121228/11513_1 /TAXON_ID=439317 /ORGANISM="Gambierdiscus australes, Strain CAWD 149" /LENGTH=253 /DNA_ID=CAMNT_0011530131 /DNA_START=103 /DNA_END=861 /DNA_ORIENTATION=-